MQTLEDNGHKNAHGVDVVSMVIGIEDNNFDSSVRSFANNENFQLAGVDCMIADDGSRSSFRDAFAYFTGLSPARIPGTGQRRRFVILNGVQNSSSHADMEVLYSENDFRTSEASNVLALIDSIMPGSTTAPSNDYAAFQSAASLPVGQADALDDADGDGTSNLLEFVLGQSPTETDGHPIKAVTQGGVSQVQFTEAIGIEGVDVSIETSTNFVDWQSLNTPFADWPRETINDTAQRVMVTLPETEANLYVRLRATLTP